TILLSHRVFYVVMPITLPPLRDRRDDIQDLSAFMIEKFNRLHDRGIRGLNLEALQALERYDWPGNIRELENVIEHAFIIEGSDDIHIDSLPPHITQSHTIESSSEADVETTGARTPLDEELKNLEHVMNDSHSLKYPELKEQFEKEFIKRALKTFNGRINQTAEQTQMTKVTLLRKLEKYNINPKEYQH
ncbi:MAG: helix-turn-helix domain-containing protein, partial [Oligoflexus sp.]